MSCSSKFLNANFFFGCGVVCQTAALNLNLLKHISVFLYMKNLALLHLWLVFLGFGGSTEIWLACTICVYTQK